MASLFEEYIVADIVAKKNNVIISSDDISITDALQLMSHHDLLSLPVKNNGLPDEYCLLDIVNVCMAISFENDLLSLGDKEWLSGSNNQLNTFGCTVFDIPVKKLSRLDNFQVIDDTQNVFSALNLFSQDHSCLLVRSAFDSSFKFLSSLDALTFIYSSNPDCCQELQYTQLPDVGLCHCFSPSRRDKLFVSHQESAVTGYRILSTLDVRNLPILDDAGQLIGKLTPHSVLDLDNSRVHLLHLPVLEFATELSGSTYAQDVSTIITCSTRDSLHTLVKKIVKNQVSEVYLVADGQFVGHVKTHDILLCLINTLFKQSQVLTLKKRKQSIEVDDPSALVLPKGEPVSGQHCWSELLGPAWHVRGRSYMLDGIKCSSLSSVFQLMHCEMFESMKPIFEVSRRRAFYLNCARDNGDDRFYVVIVLVSAVAPHVHLCMYFAAPKGLPCPRQKTISSYTTSPSAFPPPRSCLQSKSFIKPKPPARPKPQHQKQKSTPLSVSAQIATPLGTAPNLSSVCETNEILDMNINSRRTSATPPVWSPAFEKLWTRFVSDRSDDFRNSRWKVIPSIAEGNWIVKKSVGTQPALLATKLTHHWNRGPDFLEIDCDISSSRVATLLTGTLLRYAKYLVIDLAFVIQGEDTQELPEQILGSIRLSRPDISSITRVE